MMSRFRLRHVPLVLAVLARWLIGTTVGRKLLAVGVGGAALVVVALSSGGDAAKRRSGTWSGLWNEYAPTRGDFVIEGPPEKAATCQVRGRTSSASGDGWVFRGNASVAETECKVRIAKNGRVSGRLKLEKQWRGRVKGIGGDWDDTSGTALCEGDLEGTLSAGGTWKGKCTIGDKDHTSSIAWTLTAD
jgi:hypothetical protein